MLLRIRMIIWKEFLQIVRDPRLLAVVVLLPVLMLLLYGFIINLDVQHIRLAVLDYDHSRESRDLIGVFSHGEYFDVVGYLTQPRQVNETLDRSQAKVVLVIPLHYSRDLAGGRTVPVQLLVDGSDSTTASTAIGYIGAILQQQSANITLHALARTGLHGTLAPLDVRTRYWYNPELRSANFIVPGLIAVILSMLAALLTSVTVVRERDRGTIEQIIVSPIQPFELMIGKLIPYILVAFCVVLLSIAVGLFIFHVPLRGSLALVLLTSAVFITAALGIGLLISTIAGNQQVAMTGALMGTQLPNIILSGFIFPISSMPAIVQLIAQIVPAAHFIRILRGIYLKGNGWPQVWLPTLYLGIIGIAMLALSTARFKKKL